MTDIRVLRREAPKPDQDIVNKLRELLAAAETGEVQELLVYWADQKTCGWDAYVSDVPTCISIIHLHVLPFLQEVHHGDETEH